MDNQQLHEGAGTQHVLIDKNTSDHNNSTRQINIIIDPVMLDESSTYAECASICPNINTNGIEKVFTNNDVVQTPELGRCYFFMN